MTQQSVSNYLVSILFLCAIAQSDGDSTPSQIKLRDPNGDLIAAVVSVHPPRGVEGSRRA